MAIKNIQNYSTEEIFDEISRGGKFVCFSYTISIIAMTFRRSSSIFFIPADHGTFKHRVGYSTANLLFLCCGTASTEIYTIGAIFTNMTGGRDVTAEVLSQLRTEPKPGYDPYSAELLDQ